MFLSSWFRSTDSSSDNRRAKARPSRRSPSSKRHSAGRRSLEALEPRAMLATFAGLGGVTGDLSGDISDDGLVVVGTSNGQAFRWTQAGGMVGLGVLPGATSGSRALGVSADGSVIVGGSDSGQSISTLEEAFRWTAQTGMVGLGGLPSDSLNSIAFGVSADGSVAAGWSYVTSPNGKNWHEGVLWTEDSGMTRVGGSFGNDSLMSGLSGDGFVAVGRGTGIGGGAGMAVKWTAATGLISLGTLSGDTASHALATNSDGSLIVGQSWRSSTNGQAFRWTPSGGVQGLGFVDGTAQSNALDVSEDGAVIVGSSLYADATNAGAFIWTAADAGNGNRIRNLQDVLVTDYGLGGALAGWTLKSAFGVSANGRVIAGRGVNPSGGTEAWIVDLTPTETGALTVDAGAYQSVAVYDNPATLDGTVSDDGLPNPLTTTWSKQSGPGTVTFGDTGGPTGNAVDNTAAFSTSGTYVLKLSATDGLNTTFDYVYIVVTPPLSANLTSIADTYISNAGKNATKNFGGATSLIVDGDPDNAALLKWNLSSIPPGSTVQSATLSLNVTGTSASTYEIYELQRNWVETQATWNRYATTNSNWQTAGAQGTLDRGTTVLGTISAPTTGVKSISLNADGIAAVQRWVNDSATNFGLILQDYANATSDDLLFSSREVTTAANRPRLIVEYSPPASMGPAAAGLADVVPAGSPRTLSPAAVDYLMSSGTADILTRRSRWTATARMR